MGVCVCVRKRVSIAAMANSVAASVSVIFLSKNKGKYLEPVNKLKHKQIYMRYESECLVW